MTANGKPLAYQPLGNGVEYAVEDGKILNIRVPIDEAHRKAAKLSTTGKMRLLGSTGGFTQVPGTEDVRINAVVGFKA